jgi:hypothetical protein
LRSRRARIENEEQERNIESDFVKHKKNTVNYSQLLISRCSLSEIVSP